MLKLLNLISFLIRFSSQMALDGKAIKEEIPDKDTYETSARKLKGKREGFFVSQTNNSYPSEIFPLDYNGVQFKIYHKHSPSFIG